MGSPRPLDVRRPFTWAQGRSAGLRSSELRGSAFRKVFRNCYVSSDVPVDAQLLGRAALVVAPVGAFLSHHSAALLLGGVVPTTAEVHLGSVGASRSVTPGLTMHRYSAPPSTVLREGIRVTSPERTFLDLAQSLALVDLVILGDSLVRRGATTVEALSGAVLAWHGRGARNARQAALLVRKRVDSPMETRVRLLLVLAGLREPVVNYEICDEYGRAVYRVDLAYPEQRLAIEYDGRHHIDRQEQWGSDLARREDLEGEGWRFLVLIAKDVFATPGATLDRVVRAMCTCGVPIGRRSEQWRRHFPVRVAA